MLLASAGELNGTHIAARQQELRSELPLLVLPQIRMSQVPPRRRTIGPDMDMAR
jgi:hypothetical protein